MALPLVQSATTRVCLIDVLQAILRLWCLALKLMSSQAQRARCSQGQSKMQNRKQYCHLLYGNFGSKMPLLHNLKSFLLQGWKCKANDPGELDNYE